MQEETRRRGTLSLQARGVICGDYARGRGSLQMMTEGHPSLLLNYCRLLMNYLTSHHHADDNSN